MKRSITNATFLSAALVALAACQASENTQVPDKELTTQSVKPDIDPEALLAPDILLEKDTLQAANYDSTNSGLVYVGVWSGTKELCNSIDTDNHKSFAVITPNSIRDGDRDCLVRGIPVNENTARLEGACKARNKPKGRSFKVTYTLEIKDKNTLLLSTRNGAKTLELNRCFRANEQTVAQQ